MEIDEDQIDEGLPVLLHLTLGWDARTWKGFQWEAMNRLNAKGMIGQPQFVVRPDAWPWMAAEYALSRHASSFAEVIQRSELMRQAIDTSCRSGFHYSYTKVFTLGLDRLIIVISHRSEHH